ncbi:MAG: stringent starvation protein B [Caulobacteraceae bacterium]|nr:stringent starvation protein B [Caulobacteraceae bacterium]
MAQEQPPEDLMHYEAMAQDALRGVVKAALKRAASEGIPGDHHFYITFRTGAPGVSGPPELLSKYPDEMTIVLQHQYWDLTPGDTFFSVLLKFGGQPKKLSVPYAALTRFYDPSVQFLLQFDAPEIDLDEIDEDDASDDEAPAAAAPASGGGDDQPKVVSLDQFRKK